MSQWRSLERRLRLQIVGGLVLASGLVAAAVIYATAAPPAADPLGIGFDTSKTYVREVEVYGGTANVLATQMREWFDSLWHGRRLASTVAVLSSVVALGFFYVAAHTPRAATPPAP